MAERIDEVVRETAAKLNYPPEVIADVVKHIFQYMHNFFRYPTKPILRVPYLGSFNMNMFKLRHQIVMTAKYKKTENFKRLWPLRHMLYKYYKAQNLTFYGKKRLLENTTAGGSHSDPS